MDKTISRLTDPEKQQAENLSFWRNVPIGERLSAVWEISQSAYLFRAAFKGTPSDDAHRSQRTITRVK
jgi:hypothetical protein